MGPFIFIYTYGAEQNYSELIDTQNTNKYAKISPNKSLFISKVMFGKQSKTLCFIQHRDMINEFRIKAKVLLWNLLRARLLLLS